MKTPNGLRIALISAFPPGQNSLNEYGLHLALGFAARPEVSEVIVIADRLSSSVPELDLGPKIRVRRIWSFNSLWAAANITKALVEEKADAALFNLQTATFGDWEIPAGLGILAPVLARLTGTRAGVLAHNMIEGIDLNSTQLRGQRLRQLLVRGGGKLMTRLLLLSNYLSVTLEGYRSMLSAQYPNANVTLIPHGTFDTQPRKHVPIKNRPYRIVTMGKFGTYKRLETLLRAFAILKTKREFSSLELVIGGQDHPSTPGYLSGLADGCDAIHDINFVGYIPEDGVSDFFGEARVSVFDYDATTGSSGVLHQTASYGAVPVFPRIGDFVDVCRDEGLTGLNYNPGDAEGMAEAIATILRDTTRAEEIAEANHKASLGMPFSEVISRHMELLCPGSEFSSHRLELAGAT